MNCFPNFTRTADLKRLAPPWKKWEVTEPQSIEKGARYSVKAFPFRFVFVFDEVHEKTLSFHQESG